ncbi:class I SAM-dependent DNA methyltransferase [Psychrobacter sanguinis]|uniref:type I restriction-modification system subunit M n=1 Tax=Psychrobacter sanguinis TaxID=861445 RepID=UPI002A74CEB4|nr:class I SAM-dependent DNA methyltransferase [Psychrobacter sanguinis]MDY3306417.1 class I SAM-dependent DNA methyltransferase [Psychrobacter sanguinis]
MNQSAEQHLQTVHNKLVSFIWAIADDHLRDVYVRGKYRDVILPMVVLRRLDSLLEPTKEKVLEEVQFQKENGFTEFDDDALQATSGFVFYNTSKWTLKSLKETASDNQQILLANMEEYLYGYSDNVKEIIQCFKLQSQFKHMADKQVLLDVLEKFVSPYQNFSPNDKVDPEGNKLPGLSNLGMGYVFEELIRRFNEENNEEAGEHFTPREVIELMTHLVFDPVKDELPNSITVYDPACGSGGMLTESQNFIHQKYPVEGFMRSIYLYGKEINDETYAICKSDMMIKANNPENIKVGSTLSTDSFVGKDFDFMLSNPPYGKSWSSEKKYIEQGGEVIDPRFVVELADYWGEKHTEKATPRSSDGQLLFLMEMIDKMKSTDMGGLGSRIASVHNGSSLFTGDAGSGESNIRRHIIENDYLEAIIQIPNNLFYNTGITTYIWLLSNNKPAHRQGKVQLIDASQMYRKLRKNLGDKNCEFAPEDIEAITNTYLEMTTVERKPDDFNEKGDPIGIASQIFDNKDFGYYKVNIERPDRRHAQMTEELVAGLRFDNQLNDVMTDIYAEYGNQIYDKAFFDSQKKELKEWSEKEEYGLSPNQRKKLVSHKVWQDQLAILEYAQLIRKDIQENGQDKLFTDFNIFTDLVKKTIKTKNLKLKANELKQILDKVSWYDDTGAKVIKSVYIFKQDKLDQLTDYVGCQVDELPDYGYYPASSVGIVNAKPNQYVVYESSSDLRDYESVPLADSIHDYYINEVKPHVEEAWIDLDSVKIGYEISFNKYFYQHKPLRSLEEVAKELVELDQQADGLIAQILSVQNTLNLEG